MGNKAFDVTALGELLIDFTENGNSAQGNPMLEANPGGAPCNVLAMLEKLGKKTAFIGKVGNDMFGTQLKNAVEEVGIDTRNLVIDNESYTQHLPSYILILTETEISPSTVTRVQI